MLPYMFYTTEMYKVIPLLICKEFTITSWMIDVIYGKYMDLSVTNPIHNGRIPSWRNFHNSNIAKIT